MDDQRSTIQNSNMQQPSFPWSMLPRLVQVLLVRHAAPPAAALEEAAVLAEDLD